MLRNGSADTAINSIPGDVLADPAVQQLAQAICRHNGRSAVRQLHDSAASEYCAYADQISNRVKFLTRRDTANINEALPVLPTAEPAPEQAEKAFAQMPPLQARKAFLLGAPKPACCPERSRTAEGINRLRQADDPDIGVTMSAAAPVQSATCNRLLFIPGSITVLITLAGVTLRCNTHLLSIVVSCIHHAAWSVFSEQLKAYANLLLSVHCC